MCEERGILHYNRSANSVQHSFIIRVDIVEGKIRTALKTQRGSQMTLLHQVIGDTIALVANRQKQVATTAAAVTGFFGGEHDVSAFESIDKVDFFLCANVRM